MLEEVDVVTLGVGTVRTIQALVRTARFLAVDRRVGHRLSHVELIVELDGHQPVGVPDARLVVDADVLEALAQFAQLVAGRLHRVMQTVDAAAVFHGLGHFLADRGDALGPASLGLERGDTLFDRLRLLEQAGRVAGRHVLGALGGLDTGHLAEDQQFGQRVRTQTVGAVDADARAFADGVEARHRGFALAVNPDAAHRVVHAGTHGDRLFSRVDAHEGLGHFIDQRQTLAQVGFAEVTQVEVHDRAHDRVLDGAALLLFVPEGLAQAVARAEFHVLVLRLVAQRAEAVVLQVAVTVLVHEVAAFAATGFGEQQAGDRHAGRVVLHEFHVAQRDAVAEGQSHAVAGHDAAQRAFAEDAAGTTGGDDHRLGFDHVELAGTHLDGHHALGAAVFFEDVDAEVLVETLDRRVLDRGLEEGVENVEAGLVGREPGSLDLHAAEGAHVDVSVRRTAPRTTPVLELGQLFRGLLDEVFDDVLLAEPVSAANRVMKVVLQAVRRLLDAGGAAFGSHGVAAHRINLRDQCDLQRRISLGHGDRRTQAASAPSHDDYVCFVNFHAQSFLALREFNYDQRIT